jgi:protein-L-isoaspartate(D-aspartate) O-methyltransferase
MWIGILLIFFLGVSKSGEAAMQDDAFTQERLEMVTTQIEGREVRDPRVLETMRKVERHKFVPPAMVPFAYEDRPLPIGEDQTISQPYIVAFMTELLKLKGDEKVLEIGTGSGYQAAVLSGLVKEVYTIEILPVLAARAKEALASLGYSNVHVKQGDGFLGWPAHAPFDCIIVTAAVSEIPPPLVEQLKEGGTLVAPEGDWYQELVILKKEKGKIKKTATIPVRFVPLVRE